MRLIFTVLTLAVFMALASPVVAESSTSADYAVEHGWIEGYADGSLGLEKAINRAEFLKMVMNAASWIPEGDHCFSDVNAEWFAGPICQAHSMGIVNGYADGHFGPAETVKLHEALKMIFEAFDYPLESSQGGEWFSLYLETAVSLHAIPMTVDFYAEPLTRGEAIEILWRLFEHVADQPSMELADFKGPVCADFTPEKPANVDMTKVRDAWLSWTNAARANAGLEPYVYNTPLDRTATIWSVAGRDRGTMTHQRAGSSAYYDYGLIQDWFRDLGVTFDSVGGYTFTENIGRGPYSCRDSECTDEVISAMRYTFDYFMSEKGKSYRPHYNSIMNGSFESIGFGMVLSSNQYFMTVHYGTRVHSDFAEFCD